MIRIRIRIKTQRILRLEGVSPHHQEKNEEAVRGRPLTLTLSPEGEREN
jgi:hypothetical protein